MKAADPKEVDCVAVDKDDEKRVRCLRCIRKDCSPKSITKVTALKHFETLHKDIDIDSVKKWVVAADGRKIRHKSKTPLKPAAQVVAEVAKFPAASSTASQSSEDK